MIGRHLWYRQISCTYRNNQPDDCLRLIDTLSVQVAGDLLLVGNNGACHFRLQTNEGKGNELIVHLELALNRSNIPLHLRQFMQKGVGVIILWHRGLLFG